MYAGTVAGKTRSHSIIDKPGNEYLDTIHAVVTPNNKLKTDTPNINIKVFDVYLGKTVDMRWGHRPPLSPNETIISDKKGPTSSKSKKSDNNGQPQKYFRPTARRSQNLAATNQLDL